VAAGERALGPAVFEQQDWPFWAELRSRPYMRARLGLAQCLEDLGQHDEAIAHYRELLRLNPSDNQGVRYSLITALLLANRDDDAGGLLQQYTDPSALWEYSWALWTFRREGDSGASRERLRAALRSNRYVPAYLMGEREWEGSIPRGVHHG
jgi:tetratricopeptide (TPR) repeat protein